MSHETQAAELPDDKKPGYDISQASFDQDGNLDGLDLDQLDGIAGGLPNGECDGQNRMCPME